MRFRYRNAAVIFAAALIAGLCSCSDMSGSKGNSEDLTNSNRKQYEKIVYAYAAYDNIPDQKSLDSVETAINRITRKKIGAEVELMPITIADYSSNVNLALQDGEQIDIFESIGDFNTVVSGNMAYDLTNMIDVCAPETKKLLGKELLSVGYKEGKLYGIPTYKPYAATPMIIYRRDIADQLGLDMTKVKSIYSLTDILREVKRAYPDITPLVSSKQGNSGLNLCIPQVDYLTDGAFSPKGVLMGGDMRVVDYYGTKEFSEICRLARMWYNAGFIQKDAATATSSAMELMASGQAFCYIASYNYPAADTPAVLEAQNEVPSLGAVPIGEAYITTDSINALSWMISSTSVNPVAALKFLNLTFTDKDIINLIMYGIKDKDYVLDQEGFVTYPKGKTTFGIPYTAQLNSGTLGNYFLMYPLAGTSKESIAWEEKQNKQALKSPAMNFTFDSSPVRTEYAAVNNVISQYLPGLLCGSLDPETAVSEFKYKLKTAGLNNIIAEKQKQLDKWLNSKK
jgi:ABC-type sugar transport system, periplasmic component